MISIIHFSYTFESDLHFPLNCLLWNRLIRSAHSSFQSITILLLSAIKPEGCDSLSSLPVFANKYLFNAMIKIEKIIEIYT